MPNINAFWPVVHEKKTFKDLSKFSLFCPFLGPKRGQPLYLVETVIVVIEKKSFKGKR